MSRRIDFINPFGTSAYDGLITETLNAYAAQGTELTISHPGVGKLMAQKVPPILL